MKKILITGGAGFVGANLCRFLLERGNHVVCVDNFYSSAKENINDLLQLPEFTLVEHDINEKLALEVDQIYHLACPASPHFYQRDHLYTLRTCFIGSLNILELAKKNNCRILFTSTSEIYGDPEIHPQTESYFGNVNSIGPRSCYDEGKRVAESLFTNYHLQEQVDIRIVRIFNTYGPMMNEDDGRVVSNFIMAVLKGKDLVLHGGGRQTRSFCYVDDLLVGLYKLMESEKYQGPVNLGNPHEITVKELAEYITGYIKSDSKLIVKPSRLDDPMRRKPDITKARRYLNWQPSTNLEVGLEKTINYFREKGSFK